VGKFLNMPDCKPGRRSGVCIPPAPPAAPVSSVAMAGRDVPRGPAPAQPKMRVIQTQNYTEYMRLRNQFVSDPNVFVQAPQNKPGTLTQQSFDPTIDVGTRVPSSIFPEEADLSRTRIKQP
jgi:hypothetical protein